MDNTLYITLARQIQLFRNMDVVANNIANANTTGYKSESMMFTDYLLDAGRRQEVGNLQFSNDIATVRNLEEGAFRQTSRPLDAAIQGDGYFVVDAPEGDRFTRAGNFTRDVTGQIVTQEGFTVQGEGGTPITLQPTDQNIKISTNGTVTATNNGVIENRGQIRIVKFDNQRELDKISETQFGAPRGIFPVAANVDEDFRISQGVIEDSNVNSTKQVTDMIKVSRAVATTARMMQDLHDLESDTIQRISRQQ